MQVSFNKSTNFGHNPFKISPAKISTKGLSIKKEIVGGRLYKTYADKETGKLVKTVLYDYKNNPHYVTDFKDGIPREQFIYDYPTNPKQLAYYRPFYKGISGELFDYGKNGILNL